MFARTPAPHGLATWLAAGALTALASPPLALAQGPAGGYNDERRFETYNRGRASGSGDVWLAALGPLDWLRQSSRSFQTLMRLLAERAAWRRGAEPPFPPEPEPEPPPDDEGWPRHPPNGGEASAGRDPTAAVRVESWRRGAPSCRRAGIPAPLGGWYVVQWGDTLWSVAEMHYGFGGTYRRVLRANWQRIADPELIYPCQRLYIPRWHWGSHRPDELAYTPTGSG